MTTIQFDTTVDDNRQETGTFDGRTLRTTHENRPNFVLHDDGTVDLLSAKRDITIEGFGVNGVVVEA